MASGINSLGPKTNESPRPSRNSFHPADTDNHGDAFLASTDSLAPLKPSTAGVPDAVRQEAVTLTQALVQVDSAPDNLIPGELKTVDLMRKYAEEAGLKTEQVEGGNGKPVLVVTLPGSDPAAGSVGFVHHSDVVPVEGDWKLGAPYSGAITKDEQGRDIIVGRGTIDTKGPAAQVLVAMKHLKETGQVPRANMKLFVFPDEESGGKDGAWTISRQHPEMLKDVNHWVVEGSGIFAPDFLNGLLGKKDVPYLAVAQKYTVPLQMDLVNPTTTQEAVHKTLDALDRADKFIENRPWTFLGDDAETKESFHREGAAIGGIKGFLVSHFYDKPFMQKRMGAANAAANRTDFAKTDFYLSNNPNGKPLEGPNVKPASTEVVLQLDVTGADRESAIARMKSAAGKDIVVDQLEGNLVSIRLPQENYQGGHHGSTADRDHDAIDVTDRALRNIEKDFKKHGLGDKLKIVDVFTSKSGHEPVVSSAPVTSHVTLDYRIAIDEDPKKILAQLQDAVGPEFKLHPVDGAEQLDAHVRRLKSDSPLFQAAEGAIKSTYGEDSPVLFGNTTASNDTRFLMDVNPNSDALAFVPVLYTQHGAHDPDEAVTVNSLKQGVDWTVDLMKRLGQ